MHSSSYLHRLYPRWIPVRRSVVQADLAKAGRRSASPGQLGLLGEPVQEVEAVKPVKRAKPGAPNPDRPEAGIPTQEKRAPKGGGYYTNRETGETLFFRGGQFIPSAYQEAKQAPLPLLSLLGEDYTQPQPRPQQPRAKQPRTPQPEAPLPLLDLLGDLPPQPAPAPQPVREPKPAPEPKPVPPLPGEKVPAAPTTDSKHQNKRRRRTEINRRAKQILAETGGDPQQMSEAERQIVAQYSGDGGTEDTNLTQFFTPPPVANWMWGLLEQAGFEGGLVLEPSAGSGNLMLPGEQRVDTQIIGIELDPAAVGSARVRCPQSDIINERFERFVLDHGDKVTFDAAIGNPPFGLRMPAVTAAKILGRDKPDHEAGRYMKGWRQNVDIFTLGSLRMLRPGGVMAFVLPAGVTSGANHRRLREEIVKEGRVLGIYRLPNSLFEESGSDILSDVVVLQRHPQEILNRIQAGEEAVIAATSDPEFVTGRYFETRPDRILGQLTKKQNRWKKESLWVEGKITPETLQQAPPLQPTVTYAELDGIPAPEERHLQVGDIRYGPNGVRYRLNKNHRWERADIEQRSDLPAEGSPVLNQEEAIAVLGDPVRRVQISPDELPAYLALAQSHPEIGVDPRHLSMALDAVRAGRSPEERKKLTEAVLLGSLVREIRAESGIPDEDRRLQCLELLQNYRDRWGNPANDGVLGRLAPKLEVLTALRGCFDKDTGEISDYFARPAALMGAEREIKSASEAVAEACRRLGGPATLADVQAVWGNGLSDEDLSATLLADPAVGYLNGTYQPLNKLLVGNGYELQDEMYVEASQHHKKDPRYRKLMAQIAEIEERLVHRPLEEIQLSFVGVGDWIPLEALNAWMVTQGFHEVRYDEANKRYYFVDPKTKQELTEHLPNHEANILNAINRADLQGKRRKDENGIVVYDPYQELHKEEEKFKTWLASSVYRDQVETEYNRRFNYFLPRHYGSDENLTLGDIPKWDPRGLGLNPYNVEGVIQMAEQGRGVLAHGVGLGKTPSALALALKLKAEGRANKAGVVVPKSVVANWYREIGNWCPEAATIVVGVSQNFWDDGSPAWDLPGFVIDGVKQQRRRVKGEDGEYDLDTIVAGKPKLDADGNFVVYAEDDKKRQNPIKLTPKEFYKMANLSFRDDSAEEKRQKLEKVRQNAYDIVLFTEPVFQSVPLSPGRERRYMEEIVDIHLGGLEREENKDRYQKLKQREAELEELESRRGKKDDYLYWEDLGIDLLMADEAHHLKNLFAVTKGEFSGVKGLGGATSQRSLDFYYKAKYTREMRNNQNVYLLTATPTINSVVEVYNLLQHICPEEFEQRGIYRLSDFINQFVEITEKASIDVTNELSIQRVASQFKNLPELRNLFFEYTRLKTAQKDKQRPRKPWEVDIGQMPVAVQRETRVPMHPEQAKLYEKYRQDAEEALNRLAQGGGKSLGEIGRAMANLDKVTLDPELVGSSAPSAKLTKCVEDVMTSRAKGGKQLIFCDYYEDGTHDKLKTMLIEAGYPADEIVIVNGKTCQSAASRQLISNAFNNGRYTLVIGTTGTMGEGLNFQKGCSDIHNLTLPWTPAALEQREGRGVRQGNPLPEVEVHTYQLEDSFDAYRTSLLNRKRGWITDLWFGKEDRIDNQAEMSREEIAIALSKDPEAAAAAAAARQQEAAKQYEIRQRRSALQQFARYQALQSSYAQLAADPRQAKSQSAARLLSQIQRLREDLGKNRWFADKSLLDSETPAWVDPDSETVIKVGDLVQRPDGSIYRVTGYKLQSNLLETRQVLHGRHYEPSIRDYSSLRQPSSLLSHFQSGDIKQMRPVAESAVGEELVNRASQYYHLATLTPEEIDANREKLNKQLQNAWVIDDNDPEGGITWHPHPPELTKKQVVWPHTPEFREKALERIIKDMTPKGLSVLDKFVPPGVLINYSYLDSYDSHKLVEMMAAQAGASMYGESEWNQQFFADLKAVRDKKAKQQTQSPSTPTPTTFTPTSATPASTATSTTSTSTPAATTPPPQPQSNVVAEGQDWKVTTDGKLYYVRFPYDQDKIDRIKSLGRKIGDYARWNPYQKRWEIKASEKALQGLKQMFDFDLQKAIKQGLPIPRRIINALAKTVG